jgi:hypothetical protein
VICCAGAALLYALAMGDPRAHRPCRHGGRRALGNVRSAPGSGSAVSGRSAARPTLTALGVTEPDVCEERVVDQGNGLGEVVEDCHTVSEQYCSYTVDEWKTIQTFTLEGHDHAPVYAQPSISSGQRLGDESEDYAVIFMTEDGQKTYSPSDLSDFSQFQIGSTWTLSLNAVGSILDVNP